jgi:tRNA G37 N-methylase Trm5
MKLNFEELLLENGKCMDLVIQHVEIVKSYAPRVYHYVVDVKCTPRDLQV